MRSIFKFNTSDAIFLSNVSMASVAICCFVLNFRKPHPLKKDLDGKPCGLLIEYSLVIVMLPMGVIGSAFGSVVKELLPEPFLIAVLTFSLMFVAALTIKKLLLMRKVESEKVSINKNSDDV